MFKKEEKIINDKTPEPVSFDKELNSYDYLPRSKSGDYNYLGKYINLNTSALKDNFDKKKAFEYARISNGIDPLKDESYSPKMSASLSALMIGASIIAGFAFKNILKETIEDDGSYYMNPPDLKMNFTYKDKENHTLYGRIDRPSFISYPLMTYHPIGRRIGQISLLIALGGIMSFGLIAVIPFFKSIFGENGIFRQPKFDDLNPQIFIPKYINNYDSHWKAISAKENKGNLSHFINYPI